MRKVKGKSFYKEPWYNSYRSMMDRCENPNAHNYNLYGGRGIEICEDWHDIEKFEEWVKSSGYKKGLTLESMPVETDRTPIYKWCPMCDAKMAESEGDIELNPSYNSVKSELEPCEDAISREEVLRHRHVVQNNDWIGCCVVRVDEITKLPSVTPSYNSIKTELKPCEDAISRKRLIILIDEGAELHPYKVVGDSETYSDYNQGWTDAFDWLYANIDCDNLPSVKPQPKTGHWEEMELVGTGVSKFSCSVCKEGDFYNQIDNPFIPTKYCPNCGAKLMESEDGN